MMDKIVAGEIGGVGIVYNERLAIGAAVGGVYRAIMQLPDEMWRA